MILMVVAFIKSVLRCNMVNSCFAFNIVKWLETVGYYVLC